VGDFGQARKIPDGAEFVVHGEDVYDRSLSAPENYGMPGLHSRKSDVYQFGKVQWEAFTFNFGAYLKHFKEGKGLQEGLSLDQVTKRQRKKADVYGLHQFDYYDKEDLSSPLNSSVLHLEDLN